MSGGWVSDFEWQAQLMPIVKRIVGPLLLQEAPLEDDRQCATDLRFLCAKDFRIACRLRRHGYAAKYPYDFTIRHRRDSGAETEYRKLIRGWAHWMFYGHVRESGWEIYPWFIVDLGIWRECEHFERQRIDPTERANGDGTHFLAYDIRRFPRTICIGSSDPIPFMDVAVTGRVHSADYGVDRRAGLRRRLDPATHLLQIGGRR